MMLVKEFVAFLRGHYPESYQESFDNSGAQVSFSQDTVNGVLIALDLDDLVVEDALSKQCNVIITHHPFFFKPISRLDDASPKDALLYKLMRHRISLYSLHTNLDKIYYNRLGNVLELVDQDVLLPDVQSQRNEMPLGFGSSGILACPMPVDAFLAFVKEKLRVEYLVYIGRKQGEIKKVAVLNGSGGSQLEKICAMEEFDCIVTGDIGYHHAKAIKQYQILVIDAGHFSTEIIFCDFLKEELLDYLTKDGVNNEFKIMVTNVETNPFQVYV